MSNLSTYLKLACYNIKVLKSIHVSQCFACYLYQKLISMAKQCFFWGSVSTELRWGSFSGSGPRSCSLADFVAWMGTSPDVHLYSVVSHYRYGCLWITEA